MQQANPKTNRTRNKMTNSTTKADNPEMVKKLVTNNINTMKTQLNFMS